MTSRRTDRDWIDAAWKDPRTRVLVVHDGNALVQGDTQVEDARADAHTAAAALALSVGAIDIAGTGIAP